MLLRMLPRLARDRVRRASDRDPIHEVLHWIDSFRTRCARRYHRSSSACALRGSLADKVTRLADLIAWTHDSAVWSHRRCCRWNRFADRRALTASGVHSPPMAGIWGGAEGSVSIVLLALPGRLKKGTSDDGYSLRQPEPDNRRDRNSTGGSAP